jgi:N-acetylmuramoyl-L-alanine amidase
MRKIPLNDLISIDIPDNPRIDWQGLIIHHSFTTDGKLLSSFEAIKKYHMEVMGWNDIAYHYVIEYVNNILTLRVGRDLDTVGAHCVGKNQTHIGVCVVGNFDETSPDNEHYKLLSELCCALIQGYAKINVRSIKPHSLYAVKTCPGRLFDFARLILDTEAL